MSARVRIVAREDAGAGLTLVHLEVPAEIRASYTRPGQVLVVTGDGEDAYFALASRVAAEQWSLLVRDAGTVAHRVLTSELGTELPISVPKFAGFPYHPETPGPIGLVAVGSALGAVRGLYLALEAEGRAHETTLFLGVRELGSIPLRAELVRLVGAGARVIVCVSDEPTRPMAPFEVHTGLVQDAVVRGTQDGSLPKGAILYVAGPAAMMDDFRARSEALGVAVHANA